VPLPQIKGIVSRDVVPTNTIESLTYSLGLEIAPRISFTLEKSRVKIYDVSNRRFLDEKWRGLDSTLLLNSALKFVTLDWQIAVFSRRIATEKIAVPWIALVRGPNLRAECQRPETPAGFVLGLSAGVGNPQSIRELIAKQLFLLWQTAAFKPHS
jgi:hypothetical protein